MLELRNVSKHFLRIPAVDNVSFRAQPGQTIALVGHTGQILFRSKPIQNDLIGYKRRMGYVPEEPYLYNHLSGAEYPSSTAPSGSLATHHRLPPILNLFSTSRRV